MPVKSRSPDTVAALCQSTSCRTRIPGVHEIPNYTKSRRTRSGLRRRFSASSLKRMKKDLQNGLLPRPAEACEYVDDPCGRDQSRNAGQAGARNFLPSAPVGQDASTRCNGCNTCVTSSKTHSRPINMRLVAHATGKPRFFSAATQGSGWKSSATDPLHPNSNEINVPSGVAEGTPFFVKKNQWVGSSSGYLALRVHERHLFLASSGASPMKSRRLAERNHSASAPLSGKPFAINRSSGSAESRPFFVKLSRSAGVSEALAEREPAGETLSEAKDLCRGCFRGVRAASQNVATEIIRYCTTWTLHRQCKKSSYTLK
jgi:hypothetical protein